MTDIKVIERSNYSQRRYERRAAFLARKRAEVKTQSRSVEEIWGEIFCVEKPKRPVLSLKPTKHYPSEDNCCLPNVAIYAVNSKTSDKLTVNV